MRISWALFLTAAIGLGACADVSDVRSAVREADSEVTVHYTNIARSTSVSDARAELDRHAASLHADMRHLRSELDDLDAVCDDGDLDRVWAAVYAIEDRIDAYLSETSSIADLDSLREACADYRAHTESLFNDLRRRVDDVRCW